MAFLRKIAVFGFTTLVGCGSTPPPDAQPSQPEQSPPALIALVNATVVVETCPNVTQWNGRMAENAIRQMVEPCTKVPGGGARFTATMLPDGHIQLGSMTGDPADGVIPTCVVRNRLAHKIMLRKPCTFRVELEERPVPLAE